MMTWSDGRIHTNWKDMQGSVKETRWREASRSLNKEELVCFVDKRKPRIEHIRLICRLAPHLLTVHSGLTYLPAKLACKKSLDSNLPGMSDNSLPTTRGNCMRTWRVNTFGQGIDNEYSQTFGTYDQNVSFNNGETMNWSRKEMFNNGCWRLAIQCALAIWRFEHDENSLPDFKTERMTGLIRVVGEILPTNNHTVPKASMLFVHTQFDPLY